MNLVIAKYENCDTRNVFELPPSKRLCTGQLVCAKSKNNKIIATCLSDSFNMTQSDDSYKMLLNSFGCVEPLPFVAGSYTPDSWEDKK